MHDTQAEIEQFAHCLNFPMIKDEALAHELGATRSPEVFLLSGSQVIYRGRIDDQYEPGIHKAEPTRRDLAIAIEEALAGKPVTVAQTNPVGCYLNLKPAADDGAVTYAQVAPILDRRCVECHRPGQAGPFSMLTYKDTVGWAETIREVIQQGRMPPWGARGGRFANGRSLTADERRLLLAWLDAGAPEGGARPAPPRFTDDWTIKPDVVFQADEFHVPQEGVLDYQEFVINPGWYRDTWVGAVEVRPGNRAVVHHATIYLKPKYAQKGKFYATPANDNFLAMYVPGNTATILPPGMAKRVPAGWNLVLEVHYVPNGQAQTDQTSIGLELADRPTLEVATRCLAPASSFTLKPHEVRTIVAHGLIKEDSLLIALFPHMHLRGKSMLFEATYPDGRSEVLLDVYDYDFAWQFRYVLTEQKLLPAGTTVCCTAVYDNSAANKRNSNPDAVVNYGKATEDEMFGGIFELAVPVKTSYLAYSTWAVVGLGLLLVANRFRARK